MKLNVYAEKEGRRCAVGTIETVQAAGERFFYNESWLTGSDSHPLSLSLPVRDEPYAAKQMRPYFDGLLPEGQARDAMAKATKVSSRSYVKLLAAIGAECIGAVSFYAPEDEPDERYAPLSDTDLDALVHKAINGTTGINRESRMSLAGTQAKTGLYRSPDGKWFKPQGGAPSTHVVKPLNPRFENAQVNEAICMIAARACKMNVPEVEIIPAEAPLFCTQRFDRAMPSEPRLIDGLPAPWRLHQEDLSQALGVVPERKYEDGNRHYLARIAQLIRDWSARPIEDLNSLWRLVVFNFLIGNCDAHLKNLALIRDSTWRTVSLAPFYDLVCTTYYDGLSNSLAMSIGGKRKLDLIDRGAFEREADSLRIAQREAMRVLDEMSEKMPEAICRASRVLDEAGCAGAIEMGATIAAAAEWRAEGLAT